MEALRKAVEQQLTALQTQFNSQPILTSPVNGTFSGSAANGSVNVRSLSDGSIAISQYNSQGRGPEAIIGGSAPSSSQYRSAQTHAGAPSVGTNFPNVGDFGWYKNTTTGNWYFTLNFGGSLVFQDISTLAGTITTGQHGNLGGGALHAVATGSVAGFMSAADKTAFDGGVAVLTAILGTSGSPGQTLNCTQLYISGVSVLTARVAAVADCTVAVDGTSAGTQLNLLLAHMRARNLLSP